MLRWKIARMGIGIQLDRDFTGKEWNEVLLHLVPSWYEKGIKVEPFKLSKIQILRKEDIEKVPSWNENSTKLLHKKLRYLITILFLCAEPISLDKLMKTMDYKNRQTFKDNYMKPLEQVQFIERTNPDKPNDPEQKYKITEKGKLFTNGKYER